MYPGELVYEPAVYCAESELAGVCPFARALTAVEYPAYLCAGKIRIEHKPRFVADIIFVGGKQFALRRSAAALPDYCVVNGLSRVFVPNYSGLTLICDRYGGYLVHADGRIFKCVLYRLKLGGNYLIGVVLDVAGSWKYLRKLVLRHSEHFGVFIEYDSSRAGGALIYGKYKASLFHIVTSCLIMRILP